MTAFFCVEFMVTNGPVYENVLIKVSGEMLTGTVGHGIDLSR